MIGIYKITSPSGKVYIGQSRNIKKRFSGYKSMNCKGQIKLYNSFVKYGTENHIFEVVEECEFEQLNKRERYHQDADNAFNQYTGLNCVLTDCEGKPRVYSPEVIERMKLSQKGRVCTEERKLKVSIKMKGVKKSAESVKKRTGKRFHSDQHYQKLAELNKGHKYNVGRVHSDETKAKKSLALKGRKLDKDVVERQRQTRSKIIIDTQTGIFYFGRLEASIAYGISKSQLLRYLTNERPNPTSLIYA